MLRHITLAAVLALAAVPASATPYVALFTFGDSLVDSGNIHTAALAAGFPDPTPAALGYHQGRFSNGYNAADYLSLALLGHVTQGVLLGGTDFAFGGARATTNADFVPDLAAQAGLFAKVSGGHADPGALYFINAGGNDGRAQVFGEADAPNAAQVGVAIAAEVEALSALGALHFLVDNVFNLGNIPEVRAAGLSASATSDSKAINMAIAVALRGIALPAGSDLHLFNSYALGERLHADAAAFGFPGLNETTPCIVAGATPACTGYQYFDVVHPTDAIYKRFGRALAETVPEPAAFALFGLGLLGIAIRRYRA